MRREAAKQPVDLLRAPLSPHTSTHHHAPLTTPHSPGPAPYLLDSLPVTRVHLSPAAQLLATYSPTKRTWVVWDLETGKVRSAFNVDFVAHGVPVRLTASCETVLACVHAHPPGAPEVGA